MKKPEPKQTESPFGFEELFFSTTDKRGVIQFGNDVFVRISGYPKEVVHGAPHSLIRHPDMPRAVFKLLWDTLKSNQPMAAYVKNMAANGNYYWVYAFAFPIQDGYLSIRIKPSSALFKTVQNLYAQALELEKKEGMEASVPFLLDQIKKAGFRDYSDFMIQAAFAEISVIQEKNKNLNLGGSTGILADISQISTDSLKSLKECLQRVQDFQKINQVFSNNLNSLTNGFQQLKFIALNMTISAAKLGKVASSLEVVAKEFSNVSEQIKDQMSGFESFENILSSVISKCAMRIVSLEIQMLMVDFFVKESIQKIQISENAFSDMIENKNNFSALFRENAVGLKNEVHSLISHLRSLAMQMENIKQSTTGLEMIRQMGAIESARMDEAKQTFSHYIDAMQEFITLLQTSNTEIQGGVQELTDSSEVITRFANSLAGKVDSLFDLATRFSQRETATEASSRAVGV